MQAEDLIGVWIIQSFHLENIETGHRSQPWGAKPAGTVIFHPGGRMFAIITPAGRLPPQTETAQAAAYQSMLAYSGQYRIDPPNRLVTTVDISWFEPWVGSEQLRYCELDGDDLVLTSAPLTMPQENGSSTTVFAIVNWKRESSG